MKISPQMLKTFKDIYKRYGCVSISWIQYKYHVSYDEAKKTRKEFEKLGFKCS
jgi:hypothetical protein